MKKKKIVLPKKKAIILLACIVSACAAILSLSVLVSHLSADKSQSVATVAVATEDNSVKEQSSSPAVSGETPPDTPAPEASPVPEIPLAPKAVTEVSSNVSATPTPTAVISTQKQPSVPEKNVSASAKTTDKTTAEKNTVSKTTKPAATVKTAPAAPVTAVPAPKVTAKTTVVPAPTPAPVPTPAPAPAQKSVKPLPSSSVAPKTTQPATPVSSRPEPVKPQPQPVKPAPAKPAHRGTLIIVLDDAGHNLRQLQPFLNLPFPVTIAVLPGLEYSVEAAKKIRSSGKELILHQPMQAKNRAVNPGPGSIQPGMTAEQVKSIVEKNIAQIAPIAGMNNHEGSLITESPDLMDTVLDICKKHRIYFLDSKTTSMSVVSTVAAIKSMKIWERSVFIDNSQERASIEAAIRDGAKIAERNGSAIMIGHVWSNELAAILMDMYPDLIAQGYSLSTISRFALDRD